MQNPILTLNIYVFVISSRAYYYYFFNIFNENDVEMFEIMVGQNSSAQYAL